MAPSTAPRPPQPAKPSAPAAATPPPAAPAYSLFPPIPAPLQRLFDRVPLVTYPPNALPGAAAAAAASADDDDDEAARLPTLFVFIDPADAARGRASFNPTCLKWQTFLRFAGVPVRLAASNNHASPSGALPFLLPPRPPAGVSPPTTATAARRPATDAAPAPVPAHRLFEYAETHRRRPSASSQPLSSATTTTATTTPSSPRPDDKAYTALLDTAIRRAWLHAVYLQEGPSAAAGSSSFSSSRSTIAARLYAAAASASPLVRTALARELRAAAAREVYSDSSTTAAAQRSAHEEAQIYRNAEAALAALAALLGDGDNDGDDDTNNCYFSGQAEPSLFDAHVFSYTHLLLEDDDDDDASPASPQKRFRWPDRRLPDLVRAQPRLVRHRNRILARYWPAETAARRPVDNTVPGTAGHPADSVSWVKV